MMLILFLGTILDRLWLLFVVSPPGDGSLVGEDFGIIVCSGGLRIKTSKFQIVEFDVDCKIVADATVSQKQSISEFGLIIQDYMIYYT